MTDIRIFIGTGPRFEEPTRALLTSLYANCSAPERLDVQLMEAWSDPTWSHWKGQPTEENFGQVRGNWVTPFSLFRYAIPALCDYSGHAVYLDADMIVLGDIVELWEHHRKPGKWNIAAGQDGDCVAVVDCEPFVDMLSYLSIKGGYLGNKNRLRHIIQPYIRHDVPTEWNHCDKVTPQSKLVHYTNMKTQPFRPYPEALKYEEHPSPQAVELYRHWVARSVEYGWHNPAKSHAR